MAAGAAAVGLVGCGDSEAHGSVVRGRVEPIRIFGEVGKSPGQFTYPRAVDTDGRYLWIVDKSARVQRIDPVTGACSALWQMPDWRLGKPTGITVGPPLPGLTDPFLLYVADSHYNRVMIYRPPPPASLGQEPELVGKFGEFGEGPGQFIFVSDVALLTGLDGKTVQRIYVAEYDGHDRINVFDPSFKFLFEIGRYGQSAGPEVELSRPQSIQIDQGRGWLIVADACNHRVGVLTLDGKLVRWMGSPETAGPGPDSFSFPYGLALLGDGTVLVAEFGGQRVHHLDYVEGRSLGTWGEAGRGKGQFTSPWSLAVIDETVYVLDSANERIQAFRKPDRVR